MKLEFINFPETIEEIETKKLMVGKGPSGIVAAALYLAGIIRGEKRTQQSIAKIAHITEVTIRHRHKELVKALSKDLTLGIDSKSI